MGKKAFVRELLSRSVCYSVKSDTILSYLTALALDSLQKIKKAHCITVHVNQSVMRIILKQSGMQATLPRW